MELGTILAQCIQDVGGGPILRPDLAGSGARSLGGIGWVQLSRNNKCSLLEDAE